MHKKRQRAFTLLETTTVIVILAVITPILSSTFYQLTSIPKKSDLVLAASTDKYLREQITKAANEFEFFTANDFDNYYSKFNTHNTQGWHVQYKRAECDPSLMRVEYSGAGDFVPASRGILGSHNANFTQDRNRSQARTSSSVIKSAP